MDVCEDKNILITGATGMIGSALRTHLTHLGYVVYGLSRHSTDAPFHYIEDSNRVVMDPAIPLHAVINLAGPSLADRRWTKSRKSFLLQSRQNLTMALAGALAEAEHKPLLLLSASAVGYYGLTGNRVADEDSPGGNDFLATIGRRWEQATTLAEEAGINTIHLRFGVVLSKDGGVLKKLLLPFRLGLGGAMGDGRQYMSWISIFDVLHIVERLLVINPGCGPLNLVTDQATTNAEFSRRLGKTLRRAVLLPLPAWLLRTLFGEMAESLLLGSSRVVSVKLKNLGLELKHPTLALALPAILAKDSKRR